MGTVNSVITNSKGSWKSVRYSRNVVTTVNVCVVYLSSGIKINGYKMVVMAVISL